MHCEYASDSCLHINHIGFLIYFHSKYQCDAMAKWAQHADMEATGESVKPRCERVGGASAGVKDKFLKYPG